MVGDTAKNLSDRFGKVLQKRQSMTINKQDKSTTINTQLDSLIPASKISTLTQGMFVGSVSDNFDERIEQKMFHAQIVVDTDKVATETKKFKQIPVILDFQEVYDKPMNEVIENNYYTIKKDVTQIVEVEMDRIMKDPVLSKLVKK